MNAAILLCAAIIAADSPAHVRAKVLYGTGPKDEHRADIELWISQAVAKSGSPLALPHTSWIALTADHQRLYTSKQGGFIIDGKVIEKDGKYEVEIIGCEGLPLDKKVSLKPGERRVFKLTDNPAPNNTFIALEAPVTEQAIKRAEAMKANAHTLRLELSYNYQLGIGAFRLVVSVPEVSRDRSFFYRIAQIKDSEANTIINHLARDGFFDNAINLRTGKEGVPEMPGYTLTVAAGEDKWYEDFGWTAATVRRLDGLRTVIPKTGRKDMDFVLEKLSSLRTQDQQTSLKGWELFIWRKDGKSHFSLMVDTNRLKLDEEITKAAVEGFEAIKPKLDQLKKGEIVLLHGRRLTEPAPDEPAKQVAEYCKKIGLKAP